MAKNYLPFSKFIQIIEMQYILSLELKRFVDSEWTLKKLKKSISKNMFWCFQKWYNPAYGFIICVTLQTEISFVFNFLTWYLINIHLRWQMISGTRTATRSCGVWLERSWPWDGRQMDRSWTGPPLGAGEGFEALLLNFPAHPQVEM